MVYEIGEVLERMSEDVMSKELYKKIEEVRKDKNWDEFWLVFSQKPDMYLVNVIRNVWVATNERPNPISNTIHFYVNWIQGRVESKVFCPSESNIYNYPLQDKSKPIDLKTKIGDNLKTEYSPKHGIIAK